MRIRKKDKVRILAGKDKDKEGEVLGILPRRGLVLVAGVNVVKRHVKARQGTKGGILSVERPVAAAKVALLCPNCRKAARVSFRVEEGRKARFCRRCQGDL